MTFNFHYLDVVRAYKNLLQEKEALEASVNVLTTSNNQPTKSSHKKEAAEGKDQNEIVEDEKNSDSVGKGEDATSPLQEEGAHMEGMLDHPLAVKEDDVEHGKQLHQDEVWFYVLRYHSRWIDSVWKSRPYADAFKENPINLYIF